MSSRQEITGIKHIMPADLERDSKKWGLTPEDVYRVDQCDCLALQTEEQVRRSMQQSTPAEIRSLVKGLRALREHAGDLDNIAFTTVLDADGYSRQTSLNQILALAEARAADLFVQENR